MMPDDLDTPQAALQERTMAHWKEYLPRERMEMGFVLLSNAVTHAGNTISDDEARLIVSEIQRFSDGLIRQYGVGE